MSPTCNEDRRTSCSDSVTKVIKLKGYKLISNYLLKIASLDDETFSLFYQNLLNALILAKLVKVSQ